MKADRHRRPHHYPKQKLQYLDLRLLRQSQDWPVVPHLHLLRKSEIDKDYHQSYRWVPLLRLYAHLKRLANNLTQKNLLLERPVDQ